MLATTPTANNDSKKSHNGWFDGTSSNIGDHSGGDTSVCPRFRPLRLHLVLGRPLRWFDDAVPVLRRQASPSVERLYDVRPFFPHLRYGDYLHEGNHRGSMWAV